MKLFHEDIGREFIIMQAGTSEGTQIKYRKDGYWYKKDNHGHEGLAEYLVSRMLDFSSLDPSEYVRYEAGTINGSGGCRSRNFLMDGEELITFYRLYYNATGKNLADVVNAMEQMEDRIEYVVEFIRQSCKLDIRDYLRKILTLDMIVLNEDRHFNNLAVIMKDDRFSPAPIFDNGISLLTANRSINRRLSMEQNVKRVIARPFSGSHERMVKYLGTGFTVDWPSALGWLNTEPESEERNVLMYQIHRYENLNTIINTDEKENQF